MVPDTLAAKLQQARALHQQGDLDQAGVIYGEILEAQPRHVDALNLLGLLEGMRGRPQAAADLITRAMDLAPGNPAALTNRGHALLDLGRYDEALVDLEQALSIDPGRAEAWKLLGNVLGCLNRHAEAVACYEQALDLRPGEVEALCNRGVALGALKRHEEALASYEQALAINPDHPRLFGYWLFTKMTLCDWTGLDTAFHHLAAGIAAGKWLAAPFFTAATPLPAALRRKCAETEIRAVSPADLAAGSIGRRPSHDRIRLGYFSGDFREHVMAYVLAGLFQAHDRDRFEVTAFSFGPPADTDIGIRVRAEFDRVIDVGNRSDAEIAGMSRALGIDIAVDLTGFTEPARTGVFARRAAPIQVNYLGYPGTMGADFYDYIIADPVVIPPDHHQYYAEKIAHLPHTYLVNHLPRAISDRRVTREELGLPGHGFVFCNFSRSFKILPADFDLWMRALIAVKGSVLWLAATNLSAEKNLRSEAAARGVSPDRLVFKQHAKLLAEHLAEVRLADLFLDTCHYNGHATANDVLWAGVPVLARMGGNFAGRVAASQLRAAGLPELVTESAQHYEALAIELATHAPRLAALRQRLAENRGVQPLFDAGLFTRHLQALYSAMWQRYQVGLPPEHISLAP